jgi:hypothetical protein
MQAEARVLPLCPRFATAVFRRVARVREATGINRREAGQPIAQGDVLAATILQASHLLNFIHFYSP